MLNSLKSVADIQFGFYDKPKPEGEVRYIQSINFSFEHPSAFLSKDTVSPNHLLKDNDILFAAKGVRNTALKFTGSFGPAVASSIFFVIKPDIHKVLSDYLVLYLNDLKTQKLLRSLTGTTTVPHINKKDLAEIEILLPPLDQQKKIVKLMLQWEEEKKITEQLMEKKHLFYSSLFNQLIQK